MNCYKSMPILIIDNVRTSKLQVYCLCIPNTIDVITPNASSIKLVWCYIQSQSGWDIDSCCSISPHISNLCKCSSCTIKCCCTVSRTDKSDANRGVAKLIISPTKDYTINKACTYNGMSLTQWTGLARTALLTWSTNFNWTWGPLECWEYRQYIVMHM